MSSELPSNEKTLMAQFSVLETLAAAEKINPFYEIARDSAELTSDETRELKNFANEKLEKWKTRKGYNTVTVKKLNDGTWIGRRSTWIQEWSDPTDNLQKLLSFI